MRRVLVNAAMVRVARRPESRLQTCRAVLVGSGDTQWSRFAVGLPRMASRSSSTACARPLRVAVRDEWSVAVSDARQKIALTQLDVLGAAKIQNRSKATALQHAIRAEAIAVACLAASVAGR